MKTKINADGQLMITAENELESYALRKWSMDNAIEDKKIFSHQPPFG